MLWWLPASWRHSAFTMPSCFAYGSQSLTVNTGNLYLPCAAPTHYLVTFDTSILCFVFLTLSPHLALPSPLHLLLLQLGLSHHHLSGFCCHVSGAKFICESHYEVPPWHHLIGAFLEQDRSIYGSQVKNIIKHRQWPSSCRCFHWVFPRHLIKHIYSNLGCVVGCNSLRFSLAATCDVDSCVDSA